MANPDDIDARRTRYLRELAELGMERARALEKQMAAASNSEICELVAEFERVARGVREAIIQEAAIERRRRQAQRGARERVRSPRALIPDPQSRTVH